MRSSLGVRVVSRGLGGSHHSSLGFFQDFNTKKPEVRLFFRTKTANVKAEAEHGATCRRRDWTSLSPYFVVTVGLFFLCYFRVFLKSNFNNFTFFLLVKSLPFADAETAQSLKNKIEM